MASNYRRSPPTRIEHSRHRTYHLRRSPTSGRLLRLDTTPEQGPRRPVLVPLHTNLRRRPSRFQSSGKLQDDPMPPAELGSKRKRVPSANENAHAGGRPTRGSGRLKRLRSDPYEPSEAGEASGMDIDIPASARWSASASDDESLSDLSSDENRAETSMYLSNRCFLAVYMLSLQPTIISLTLPLRRSSSASAKTTSSVSTLQLASQTKQTLSPKPRSSTPL